MGKKKKEMKKRGRPYSKCHAGESVSPAVPHPPFAPIVIGGRLSRGWQSSRVVTRTCLWRGRRKAERPAVMGLSFVSGSASSLSQGHHRTVFSIASS